MPLKLVEPLLKNFWIYLVSILLSRSMMQKYCPLVFTHYGNSDYLFYTLRQAKYSNPGKDLILIGDKDNYEIATQSGWKHYDFNHLQSPKRDEFNARFRWVQGKNHYPVKGGKDWLRYVSERFFAVETFLQENNIFHIWHFDSDTMILHDLSNYESKIIESGLDCTTLCNDSCPSGFISKKVIQDYCSHMIEDYKNEFFLALQQKEFDEVNTGYAYTEMRAFENYRFHLKPITKHLASLFSTEDIWFDDCMCQDHGFSAAWADKLGKAIKDFSSIDGSIICQKNERAKNFATINCSWVSLDVYQWIENISRGQVGQQPKRLVEYLAYTREQRFKHFLKSNLKSLFNNVRCFFDSCLN